ncbi:MAG: hypothetical protein HGB02_00265 [Chlorobiaceae bacterium]|nr:hypothetical protein [Chlorobiaceae bacterium]
MSIIAKVTGTACLLASLCAPGTASAVDGAGISVHYGSAFAVDRYQKPADGIHLDVGLDTYYTKYNFDNTRDESNISTGSGYYLFSLPVTLEARHYLSETFCLTPYARTSVTYDFGEKSWNKSYWNNNQIFAAGVKLTTEHSFMNESGEYIGGISTALFSEYEVMTSSFDNTKERVPATVDRQNVKTGVSFWFSKEKPLNKKFGIWTENWGEFAWHTSAFSAKGQDNFLLGSLSSKIGTGVDIGKVAFEPYLTVDLVNDFLTKEWNKASWFNNVQYGPGARLVLDRVLPGKLSVYAEYLLVNAFEPQHLLIHDVKAGLACWFPIL